MKTDFRSLPREVRADRRRTAFEMMDENYSYEEIRKRVKAQLSTISDWKKHRKEFEKNNYHGLKRGNPNDQKVLNQKRQSEILKKVIESTPDKEGISSFLWSRKALRELVKKNYDLDVSPQLMSLYAKRLGLSSQRPKKQASEQDPKKVELWLKKTYPRIKKQAKEEKALIHWCDETNLNINTNYQKTYAPKGKTPIAKIPARKTSYSMVSSLTNQGKLRYMVYKGGMNAILFRAFLKRLVKDTDQKIFLIVDNLKVHHAKIIQIWQRQNSHKIEIFFPAPILPARKS